MIESSQNNLIKKINALKQKKGRDRLSMFLIEGLRLVSEIPVDFEVESYIFSDSFYKMMGEQINQFNKASHFVITDKLFKFVSDIVNPQGIMAICHKKIYSVEEHISKKNSFFVVLENVTDPGNMGTIIRTADAAGVDCIFLTEGCVDLYNPKVLRGTMGSVFHLPIVMELEIGFALNILKSNQVSIIATHLNGSTMHYECDFKGSCAILIGNEANGLSDYASQKSDFLVKIPIIGRAESLNASVACGILLYEAVRQRSYKKYIN